MLALKQRGTEAQYLLAARSKAIAAMFSITRRIHTS
ncbi:unnamed protein product [Strongylus vulgaris]|uniref:Uncharacterized protein n=1 Tax=Strongylus vulgaris TaxID=40348 RepID=A0A3P7K0V7_STRVU|nr:unnamed protein product [Strongylus vulgaris]